MIKRIQYAICWLAYVIWPLLPPMGDMESRWGRFKIWLYGYGAVYGYSDDFEDFRQHVNFWPEPRP